MTRGSFSKNRKINNLKKKEIFEVFCKNRKINKLINKFEQGLDHCGCGKNDTGYTSMYVCVQRQEDVAQKRNIGSMFFQDFMIYIYDSKSLR